MSRWAEGELGAEEADVQKVGATLGGGDTWERAQAVLGGAVSSPPLNALTSMG